MSLSHLQRGRYLSGDLGNGALRRRGMGIGNSIAIFGAPNKIGPGDRAGQGCRGLEALHVIARKVRCLVEGDGAVVTLGEDAVEDDDVEVGVEVVVGVGVGVEGRAEAVQEGDGAELGVAWSGRAGAAERGANGPQQDPEHVASEARIADRFDQVGALQHDKHSGAAYGGDAEDSAAFQRARNPSEARPSPLSWSSSKGSTPAR